MHVFKIKKMFKEEKCVGGKESGRFLRNEMEIALAKGPVVIDFEDVQLITQSFSDEFLGPILADAGQEVLRNIKFKNCSQDIQTIILSTATRFLSDAHSVSY